MRSILRRIDIGRMLLALLLALALYSAVRAEQNPPESGTFEVPVDISNNVPPGMLLVGGDTSTVQIRVSAPREEWVSLRPGSFRAWVQLSRGTTGVDEYPVQVDGPNPRVRVLEVIPPRLPVRLDENVERSVPVRLARVGNVPFGYEAGDAEIDPLAVSVGGPGSLVRRVEAVSVEVRLDAATVDIDGRYTVTPVDAQGLAIPMETRTMRMSPSVVHIRIPITQQLSYKTVGVQPDIGGTPQSGYVIGGVTTEPATLTIVGAPRALAGVDVATTERVDVTDASAPITRQARVTVPDGVSVVQQETVRVSVRISPIVLSQSFTTVPSPENVGADVQITSPLQSVQVVLQGPSSALQSLRPNDLRVTVNLAGLGAGTHQPTVDVTAPAGVSVQAVNPRVISVTLASTVPPTPTPEPTAVPSPTPPVAQPPFASPTPEEE